MTRATLLRSALVAAVAAGAAVVWLGLQPADEDDVLAPLRGLAQAVGVEAGAQRLGVERAAQLAASFTAQAAVDLGPPFLPVAGREALVREAAALPVPAGGLRLTLLEMEAVVDRRLLLANATVTAQATTADGAEVLGARTYDVALRQRDGAWLIHDVRPADRARQVPADGC